PDARARTLPVPPYSHIILPAHMAFTSIGYLALPLPGQLALGIPFNPKAALIPNERGRVVIPVSPDETSSPMPVPGVYTAGWVKRGPTGVIASTMADAFETADAVVEDWTDSNKGFLDYGGEKRD